MGSCQRGWPGKRGERCSWKVLGAPKDPQDRPSVQYLYWGWKSSEK